MPEARDNFHELLKNLEREHENTLVFLVESVQVLWSPIPGPLHDVVGVGFIVVLSGAVELQDFNSCAHLAKYPRGFVELSSLPNSGYPLNDQGRAIVGALSMLGHEMAAKLLLPADDLRALATLVSVAAKERPRVRVWMHAFEGLKGWDGKEALTLARTTIHLG